MELFKGETVKSWLEASSLVAAGIYALGWIFVARLFSRFGVTPEEAGFSFAYLLIRVVFFVIAFAAVVLLIVWSLNRLADYGGTRHIDFDPSSIVKVFGGVVVAVVASSAVFSAAIIASVVAVFSGAISAAIQLLTGRDSASDEANSTTTATAETARSTYKTHITLDFKSFFRYLSYGFAMISVCALIAVPFIAADRYADRIQDGKELRAPILPGILSIQRVQASTSDDEPISPQLGSSACVHLLGSSGGMVVLYDHEAESVVRVPQGRVSLEDPCN